MSHTAHPDPNTLYPIEGFTRTCYLKNIIRSPQIIVGDYTYYDDPEDIYNFEKNVLYLFDFMQDKLIIGKFCQIATGARFIMNGSNMLWRTLQLTPLKSLANLGGRLRYMLRVKAIQSLEMMYGLAMGPLSCRALQ